MGRKGAEQQRNDFGASRGGGAGGGAVGWGLAAGVLGAMAAGGGGGDGGDDGGFIVVFVPGSSAYDPSDPYCMKVWGLVTGSAKSFDAGSEPAVALAVSSDGSRGLSATKNNMVHYWGLPP
jgi:hypothetical protein